MLLRASSMLVIRLLFFVLLAISFSKKGVVFLPVGAWYDPINDGDFCIHGNPNVLTEDIGTSSLAQGPSAHSTLVEIKKYTKELPEINVLHKPSIVNK